MKLPLWCLLLVLAAPSLMAETIPHRVLVHYVGPAADKYVPTLVSALGVEDLALPTVVSRAGNEADTEAIAKEARRFACDIILRVEIKTVSGQDTIVWSLGSPVEDSPRTSGKVTKASPGWSSAADLYWLFLIEPLSKQVGADSRQWPQPPLNERAEVVVRARAGTFVTGFPDGPVTLENDEVSVVVALPVSLYLEGHLQGWTTTALRVYVDQPGMTVELPQTANPRWAVTASLNNFSFPSVAGEWYPDGKNLSVRFGLDQYMGGVALQDSSKAASTVFVSLPMSSVIVGAGWRWSWPEDQLSFSTNADLGLRLFFPQYRYFTLEPVAPVFLNLTVAWDYKLFRGQSIYYEIGPTLTWISDSAAYHASVSSDSFTTGIELPGVPLVLWLPLQARVGYRWSF